MGGGIGANGRQLVSTTGAIWLTITNPSRVDEAHFSRTPEQILAARQTTFFILTKSAVKREIES